MVEAPTKGGAHSIDLEDFFAGKIHPRGHLVPLEPAAPSAADTFQ
jgi:hypothetical protein